MKKALIAGVASVAIAAMPVAGVFAAANPSNFVDTLKVTIADSCTWTRTLTAGTDVTVADGAAATASVSATMTAGQKIEGFGVSTLNVKCNNDKGYKIKGTFTDLSGYKDNSKKTGEELADKIEYGGAAAVSAGKWVARLGEATTGLVSGTDGNVASTTAGDNMSTGSTYVVTYDVQTAADQSAGYYEGTATYELTQNS